MAEYRASIAVSKLSDAYSIARDKAKKAKEKLDETPTSSPNYSIAVSAYKNLATAANAALKAYEEKYKKEKADFEAAQKKASTEKKGSSLEAKIKVLKDDLQRAKDAGQPTTAIEAALKQAQDDLAGINKQKEEQNRPKGVPADAKFNASTGNWESGTQKWDKNGQAVTETKTSTKTPKKTDTSKDGVKTPPPKKTDIKPEPTPITPEIEAKNLDELYAKAVSLYGGIDEIFKSNDELRALLKKAVGKVSDPVDDYSATQFINELENTNWFKTNAGPIRQRGFYERQYNDLVNKIKTEGGSDYQAKLDELNRTSEYGRGLQDAIESVNEYVTKYLGINAVSPDTIRTIASDLYRYANETDPVKVRNAVLAATKYGTESVLGGATGQNLTTLKSIAAANGLDLDTAFKTSIPTWLDNLNKGESIETYKKIIRDAAKTAFNVSDRVAALLDQGVDLDTIYSPYKNLMSSVLEINPKEVTLKDIANYGVIGNKDQMNLYDFQRALRKDPRWEYTSNAKQEVSNSVLGVLRDFGFQG